MRGHKFTIENTWIGKDDGRRCRQCARLRQHVGPLPKKTLKERLLECTVMTAGQGPNGDCWTYVSNGILMPYAQLQSNGKKYTAHRLAYEFTKGKIPTGQVVRHTCDNATCVNPAHLILGTQADNIADMMSRGRHANHSKTHCRTGHPLTIENTYIGKAKSGNPSRHCRICRRESLNKCKERIRVAQSAIRKLPANHPARHAYAMNGVAGWQQWKAAQ